MQIKYLPHAPHGYLKRASSDAAGYDLRACSLPHLSESVPFGTTDAIWIGPGEVVEFGTGVAIYLGAGYEETSLCGIVVPRSGLGSRGLLLANGTGVIDPDYQGEIRVKLRNVSGSHMLVHGKDRIAQILFVPVFFPAWEEVSEFTSATERGAAGFGSTGAW